MIDRDQLRRDLRAGLLPVSEIARRAGCSVRTVYRIAGEAKREPVFLRGAGTWPEQIRHRETEAEAKKALSALISDFENYYKE